MGELGGSRGRVEEGTGRHDVEDRSWMRSMTSGHRDFVFVDGIAISEDEYAQMQARPKSEEAKEVVHEGDEGLEHDSCIEEYVSGAQDSTVPTLDHGTEFKTLSPGSIYRGPGDQRALTTKAFEFVKKGAEGIASVSRTAAVEIAKVSRTTSKQVMDKSVELQNLAAPVLAPIFQAVIDEGRDQPMSPSEKASAREHIQREAPNPAELERMATPYVQPTGRWRGRRRVGGRGKCQVRVLQRPMQQQSAAEGAHMPVMLPMASSRAGGIPPQAGVVLPMGVSTPRGPVSGNERSPSPESLPRVLDT